MAIRQQSPERSKNTEELTKPRGESKEYSEDMRDLMQAREILDQLHHEVGSGPMVGWEKLLDAKRYIDKLITEPLESEKDK